MKRRVSTSLLIEVDLERDRGPRIAGDELVVRLHERAREFRSRELFGGERREAAALRHALGGTVREDDRDAFPRAPRPDGPRDGRQRGELALALGGALVDATLLSGHVREDRFGIGTRHAEGAELGRLPEDRADLRLLQQHARLERDGGELAAQVERERQQDEDADERRVDERERSEVEEEAATETLLPEEKERLRHEFRPRREHVRVRTGREREAEPRDRDRREDEHVAQDLEHRPEARVRAGEQLRETARVDRADVALGLRRAAVVDGVGEATKQGPQARFARERLIP